jgi:hypothetical protein
VGDYITALPDFQRNSSRVVEGWGWDHASWDVEKWPTWVSSINGAPCVELVIEYRGTDLSSQEDLEANPVVAGRLVILQSRDGHAIWVSRRTLEANAPYPNDVEGGVIFRDEQGNPTGLSSARLSLQLSKFFATPRSVHG